jgi:hypothetical protein
MEFINKDKHYPLITETSKQESLWQFLHSEKSNFISDAEKAEVLNWMNKVHNQYRRAGDFFSNLKEVFTEDGICHLREGQEDVGAVQHNNSILIIRHSDFGVAFNFLQLDGKDNDENSWDNYRKIISALEIGFINPKDFHLLKVFDNMNNELEKKDSVKERKVKI